MDYDEAVEWLYGTQLFGIKLGLEGSRRLFDALDLFEALKEKIVFHVAGTNGKGSVCAMIDSVSQAAGKRCGLFTSPHLVCFRERIRINGAMIPESEVAQILTTLRDKVCNWKVHPTFFELTLALAVKYFCQGNVEVLVMETGMGGRLDATNVLPSSVSVITSVALDHQQWLGEDLESVAGEKAGIIKLGIPVVTPANQDGVVLEVLRQVAHACKTRLHEVDINTSANDGQGCALKGPHQRLNAALVRQAVSLEWPDLSQATVDAGLREVNWPGRFDLRAGNIIIDGAHNPAAMDALVATWREEFGNDVRATIVFGVADSKEVAEMLVKLAAVASRFVFVELCAKRGKEVEALAKVLSASAACDIPWSKALTISDALSQADASGAPVLVTGSLFLAGEVLAHCEKREAHFETSEQ